VPAKSDIVPEDYRWEPKPVEPPNPHRHGMSTSMTRMTSTRCRLP
jgi:hypothetical protein